MDKEGRLNAINKQQRTISLIESPFQVMLGLGLYAKFAANGDAFHPLLNDEDIVNTLLFLGASAVILGSLKIAFLVKTRIRLQNESDL